MLNLSQVSYLDSDKNHNFILQEKTANCTKVRALLLKWYKITFEVLVYVKLTVGRNTRYLFYLDNMATQAIKIRGLESKYPQSQGKNGIFKNYWLINNPYPM